MGERGRATATAAELAPRYHHDPADDGADKPPDQEDSILDSGRPIHLSPPPPPKDIPRFFLGADSTASAIAHSKFAPPAPTKRRLACVSSHPNHSWGGVGDVGVGWGGGGCRGGGGAVGGCTGGGVRVGDVGVGDVGMESVGVGGVGVGAAWGEVDGVCREER